MFVVQSTFTFLFLLIRDFTFAFFGWFWYRIMGQIESSISFRVSLNHLIARAIRGSSFLNVYWEKPCQEIYIFLNHLASYDLISVTCQGEKILDSTDRNLCFCYCEMNASPTDD